MPARQFQPSIPTRATKVPAGPDWIHEVKHDGYRLIVQREGKRVRLFTRNGHNWTDRYPLIVEAALKNRSSSFVIDGEAVLLGVDGVSDFGGLHTGKHDAEVQLYAFDCLDAAGQAGIFIALVPIVAIGAKPNHIVRFLQATIDEINSGKIG
jgi:bifunctional non-homologous end joining protein LigD